MRRGWRGRGGCGRGCGLNPPPRAPRFSGSRASPLRADFCRGELAPWVSRRTEKRACASCFTQPFCGVSFCGRLHRRTRSFGLVCEGNVGSSLLRACCRGRTAARFPFLSSVPAPSRQKGRRAHDRGVGASAGAAQGPGISLNRSTSMLGHRPPAIRSFSRWFRRCRGRRPCGRAVAEQRQDRAGR